MFKLGVLELLLAIALVMVYPDQQVARIIAGGLIGSASLIVLLLAGGIYVRWLDR